MSLANRMQSTATRLLSKFDESKTRIKLIRKGLPVWDETAGEVLPGIDETFDLVGVTVPVNEVLVNGTTIQSGDAMITVTSATKPKIDDKLLIDGVQWSIVAFPSVNYTGVDIAYKIQARK